MEHQALTQEHRDPARPLVLVTGATGNLGGKMVEALLAKGWRVRGQYRHRLPLDPRVEWRQLDFAALDLTDADFDHLLEGVGAVLHFAASLAEFPAEAEGKGHFHLPLVMDWVKGVKTARSLSLRRPQGAFRMDYAKLRATGFVHHP